MQDLIRRQAPLTTSQQGMFTGKSLVYTLTLMLSGRVRALQRPMSTTSAYPLVCKLMSLDTNESHVSKHRSEACWDPYWLIQRSSPVGLERDAAFVCYQGSCLEATAGAKKLSKAHSVTVTCSHNSTPFIISIILTSYHKCIKIWQIVS